MELQLAVQSGRSHGRNTKQDIPNYLKPSTGSCHHVCKYGGAHTFEERDAQKKKAQPKPRKQPPVSDQQKRSLMRVRLVPRKLFGDRSRGNEKVEKEEEKSESVEWKDIVAYDTAPAHGSSPPELDDNKPLAQPMGSAIDVKTKDVMRGKKPYDTAKVTEQVDGVKGQNDESLVNKSVRSKMMTSSKVSTTDPTHHKNMNTDTKSSVRPQRRNNPTVSVAKNKAVDHQDLVDGYQPLSPSLLQQRASLLRDLEEEMGHEATNNMNGSKPTYSLVQEAFAAAEASRPVPAHRRVKSMSLSSSRSVRFPFARQASKNSSAATFKLRSKSSKGLPILPYEEEEKPPARPLRSRRGSVGGSHEIGGRGIQLRIRSLRRRGAGGASTGFVVPAVALRHQKTLEKKRSQRLYNNVIEETASKLVKTRKSRVKALVGAFESVISKISK